MHYHATPWILKEVLCKKEVHAASQKLFLSTYPLLLDFRQEALNLQNEFRAVHNVGTLDMDESLCIEAEMYATHLAVEGSTTRSDTDEGESVIKSCTINMEEMSADEAIRKWYVFSLPFDIGMYFLVLTTR